ncbi:MAG: YraN family protein [Bacteroidales bacterium]|jgi:putative endonuclease|nr:YraN family protein [Bacteroidales bacterium]
MGKTGELQACNFLIHNGYTILHTNWRYKHLEVDIIAQKEDFLVFCEVKCRTSALFGMPESFVTRSKQKKIIAAATAFMQLFHIQKEVRFDIIAVLLSLSDLKNQLPSEYIHFCTQTSENQQYTYIMHIKEAYIPQW